MNLKIFLTKVPALINDFALILILLIILEPIPINVSDPMFTFQQW